MTLKNKTIIIFLFIFTRIDFSFSQIIVSNVVLEPVFMIEAHRKIIQLNTFYLYNNYLMNNTVPESLVIYKDTITALSQKNEFEIDRDCFRNNVINVSASDFCQFCACVINVFNLKLINYPSQYKLRVNVTLELEKYEGQFDLEMARSLKKKNSNLIKHVYKIIKVHKIHCVSFSF